MAGLEKLRGQLTLVESVKQSIYAYATAVSHLIDLEEQTGNPFIRSNLTREEYLASGQSLLHEKLQARQYISEHLQELTETAAEHDIAHEITIFPPPMLGGGYTQTLNVFDAFIKDELPYKAEIKASDVFDILDQLRVSIKRKLAVETQRAGNPIWKLLPVWTFLARMFKLLFQTDRDRSIVKWLFISTWILLLLRFVFGVPLDSVGRAVVSWFK